MKLLNSFFIFLIFFIFSFRSSVQNIPSQNIYSSCSHAKSITLTSKPSYDHHPLLFNYNVKFYFLDLEVENNTTFLKGRVRIDALVTWTFLDTFAIELTDALNVDSVLFNNSLHSFLHKDEIILIPLENALSENDLFSVELFYQGNPNTSSRIFSGISTAYSEDWDINVTWTLSEPFSAKDWWPVKQVLEDKADSVWVFLTTDSLNKAGSQGILTDVRNMDNGKLRYEWKSKYPIDYYLISFSVSDYQDYSMYAHPKNLHGDSILIQNFLYDRPGFLGTVKPGLKNTVAFIELFCDLFSLYPFFDEKYGHCYAELGGGMEHQTMSTMGGFGFGIVAHELAHQWFGDLVTCATWSDIWINEGFATYSDYLAHEYIAGGKWPQIWLENVSSSVLSEPGGSVYIPPSIINENNVSRIFDERLSYRKGAYLLHMIRFELQDDSLFYEIIHEYLNTFKDSVATGLDFMSVINDISGKDFSYFFDQWYFGEGYPIYHIDASQQVSAFTMNISQSTSTSTTTFFKMLIPYQLIFNDKTDTTLIINQTSNETTSLVFVEKQVVDIIVDPENHVLNKVTSINLNGVDILHKPPFNIFPNPFTDQLQIVTNTGLFIPAKFTIFDRAGNHVHSGKLSYPYNTLSTDFWTQGLYFISIKYPSGSYSQKILKY